MKIDIVEDESIQETEIIIKCKQKSSDIDRLLSLIDINTKLICKKGKEIYQIPVEDIIYIESVDEKSFVYLQDSVYENQNKLYELEEILKDKNYIRISKSCLLHLKYLRSVRAMLNGKYEATLSNGEKLIINRNYMAAFRKVFGM